MDKESKQKKSKKEKESSKDKKEKKTTDSKEKKEKKDKKTKDKKDKSDNAGENDEDKESRRRRLKREEEELEKRRQEIKEEERQRQIRFEEKKKKREAEEEAERQRQEEERKLRAAKREEEETRRLQEVEQQRIAWEQERENARKREEEEREKRRLEELREYEEKLKENELAEQRRKEEEELRRQLELKARQEKEESLRQMRGFLVKQGHIIKNWKKRFFVLENGQISYYIDETCSKMQGNFKLKDSTFKVIDEYIEGRNYLFSVKTAQGKIFLIEAPSEADRQKWYGDINENSSCRIEAIKYHITGVLPFHSDSKSWDASEVRLKGNRIAKSGWLEKEGHVRKNWKTRWFVLTDQRLESRIQYFHTSDQTSPKGEIWLEKCTIVQNDRVDKPNCFIIHTETKDTHEPKDFLLSAETEAEMQAWIKAINAAVQALKQERSYENLYLT